MWITHQLSQSYAYNLWRHATPIYVYCKFTTIISQFFSHCETSKDSLIYPLSHLLCAKFNHTREVLGRMDIPHIPSHSSQSHHHLCLSATMKEWCVKIKIKQICMHSGPACHAGDRLLWCINSLLDQHLKRHSGVEKSALMNNDNGLQSCCRHVLWLWTTCSRKKRKPARNFSTQTNHMVVTTCNKTTQTSHSWSQPALCWWHVCVCVCSIYTYIKTASENLYLTNFPKPIPIKVH